MNLASLSAAQLRNILSLVEKKEAVQAELEEVKARIAAMEKARGATEKPGKAAAKTRVKAPVAGAGSPVPQDGTLKEAIFELLALAGEAGTSVKEIAEKLKITPAHAHVWFGTIGKKSGQIHKVKRGVYGLKPAGN